MGDSCVSVTRRRWREGRLEGEAIVIARLGRGRRSVQFQGPFFARGVRAEAWSRSGEGWPCYIGGPQTCPTDTSHSTSAGVSRLSSLKQDRQDEQAPHRACAGACRRPRGALRAARVAKQRLNRPHSTKTQCDASSGPCARLSPSQRVALRSRYALPPLRPATQQKPPRAAHGSNGGSRPRATQIALPRNGAAGPPALATTLP